MFSFLRKKSLAKRAALVGAVLVLLTSFLFVSCPNPAGSTTPVNAKPPNISGQPQGDEWDVASEDTFDLTVIASATDGGQLSYQWYSNTSDSNSGGTPINSNDATLRLAKENYTENKDYYFYVVVTNTISDNGDGGTKTATATSNVATVTVDGVGGVHLNAEKPVIKTQPANTFWNVFTTESGVKLTVAATVEDGGTLSYQWYSNTSASNTNGTKIDTATGKDYTLTKTAYTANGAYYFYAIITNTNNDITGIKTVSITSNAATVTVVGYPDTGYSDTHTMPSKLTGEWESEWGEIFTISSTEFSSGADWGDGWSGYKGIIVNHRGNAAGTEGYITIKYTQNDWDSGAEDKYYVVYYKDLTETTVTIAGAGLLADPDFGLSGGRASKDEAEATYTVSAGYFASGSDLTKAEEAAIYLDVDWKLNDGEWETGSHHPTQILSGTALAKPAPAPFRDWYDFAGWYSDEDLTTQYDFANPVTAPLHLYAKWEEAFWTITWNLNGGAWGAGANGTGRARVDKGTAVPKPSPDPSLDNHDFIDWFTNADGTGSAYNFSSPVTAPLTLYAKWNEKLAILDRLKADLTELPGGTLTSSTTAYRTLAGEVTPIAVYYKVPAELNLDANDWEGWKTLLEAIWDVQPSKTTGGGGKYFNLDLSDCAMTGTVINWSTTDRGAGISSGALDTPKNRIATLILPKAATSIGNNYINFMYICTSITGENIETIAGTSHNLSNNSLITLNYPKAKTLGNNVFQSCAALTTLNLPSLESLGNNAFQSVSASPAGTITITLGPVAPTVGIGLIAGGSSTKIFNIKVPNGATGYGTIPSSVTGTSDTTPNWLNGFRGYGWDGTATIQSTGLMGITVNISYQEE